MALHDALYSQDLKKHSRQRVTSWLLSLSLLFMSLLLSACGGGSASDSENGDVIIGLTDAKGDFATYTVDVLSLTLSKQNGQTVETLPINTRVDFARYTDLTEFLTAASIPNGIYVKGSMLLDYSNADIQVEDADGNAIQVNTIVDEQGDPVVQLETSVRLDGRNRLPIAPGIPASLTLDFDLKRSNTVVFDTNEEPTVTVVPILVAEVNGKAPKHHRVRGPLKSVNLDKNQFALFIRPFIHSINLNGRDFGVLNVHVDDKTVYEINGNGFTGDTGLQELALQTEKTGVIARGVVRFAPRRFVAQEVYAGSSVPGGTMDVVRGSVIGRSGDVLSVRGATLERADGSVTFQDNVAVEVDESTTVRKQLSADTFAIDDISVGQAVTIFGSVSTDETGTHTLDASNGFVRMGVSVVRGSVVNLSVLDEELPLFPFAVDISTINGRNVSLYNFAGTGIDSANDAEPSHYEIDTLSLDVSAIAAGTRVAVGGFVTPFATAPADFTAQTIVTPANTIGIMPPIDDSEEPQQDTEQ